MLRASTLTHTVRLAAKTMLPHAVARCCSTVCACFAGSRCNDHAEALLQCDASLHPLATLLDCLHVLLLLHAQTRLPRPLLNLLLFFNPDDGLDEMAYAARLDDCEYDLTNPWSFLKSMRNKFDAHRDPARAAAIAAAGYTNGAMVYK